MEGTPNEKGEDAEGTDDGWDPDLLINVTVHKQELRSVT